MIAIEHSSDGRIAKVTLNRPDRRNALNQRLVTELTNAVRSLGQDERLRVIVLTGAGSVFSAGADLDAIASMTTASAQENLHDSTALADLFMSLRSCPKLTLAKINGHAIAGGAGLVASCDVSIASKSAKFGFTETRLGFIPALVSVLLRNRINETRLRDILLSARLFDANEAVSMGLITSAVEPEQLEAAVDAYASAVCRTTSAAAVAQTKKLLEDAEDVRFDEAMGLAAQRNADARGTSDCQSGIRAFLDKQDPPWMAAYDADNPSSA